MIRILFGALLAAMTGYTPLAAQRNVSTKPVSRAVSALPGHVVDVTAGEFYFKAPDTIPEGLTTFRLLQAGLVVDKLAKGLTGRDLVADKGDNTRGAHGLWVVRLAPGKTMSDLYRAAQTGERTTSWATQIGGPSFALPPRTANATVDLSPGNYVLVCYVGSAREDKSRYHFLNGMARPLTVARSARRSAPLRKPDVVARIGDGGTVHLSGPIVTGTQVLRVENSTDADYEFKFMRMPDGLSAKDFLTQSANQATGIPWGGLMSVPPKATVTTTIEFPAGEYVLGTWASIRHPTSQIIIAQPGRKR